MPKLRSDPSLVCSFCGKREDAGRKIVPGPGVAICDHCIQLCKEYLIDSLKEKKLYAQLFEKSTIKTGEKLTAGQLLEEGAANV